MPTPNNNELVLDSKDFLVSETDSQGRITFANDEFCKYSGYTIEELLGKPHSFVRHPDMPKAAFKDLWESVKSGQKWRGFVKNLASDGGYYWVYATVFPFLSCDGSNGYVSCRRKASEEEIKAHETLYKQMRREER